VEVLRTPDARFVGLPGFSFAPHYGEVANAGGPGLRIHYLDEGPQDAAPVLLLHGEPSWCYLYRHVVPLLAARGHRDRRRYGLELKGENGLLQPGLHRRRINY
jgi:haloalkane dehalogenase